MKRLFIFFFCWISSISVFSQILPDDFYEELVLAGRDFPTGLTFDQNGRMFFWEKKGVVWLMDAEGHLQEAPFLDISEEVSNWKDHGLMGFALDPGFLSNGYCYALYALDLHHYDYYGTPQYHPDSTVTWKPTIGRVTRFKADPLNNFSRVLPETRTVLLGETIENGIPILYEFHGLGSIVVAEDGTLLISCGDATSNASADMGGDSIGTMVTPALARGIITPDQDVGSYKAQYLGAYSGKVLRISAENGDGLSSNPFYDPSNPRSPQSRTWAYGLRNPYRIAIRPNTGSHFPEEGQPGVVFVGDVGNGAWEELDIVTFGGQNFGWPIMEAFGGHFPFYSDPAPANQLRPNPLFGQNGCEQAFFTFKDIYKNLERYSTPPPTNPCNPTIPVEGFVIGYPPVLCWNNARWNPPTRAQVPVFNEQGFINGLDIGTEGSNVSGEVFEGYSSLAGVFYESDTYPAIYKGKYFAVDFSGWIKAMEFDAENHLLSVEPFHQFARDIIHLALNPADGILYYIDLEGNIKKITYGGNPAPVAIIEMDKNYGGQNLTVQFDASNSYDPNLSPLSYSWDFGDGSVSQEKSPTHTFTTTEQSVKRFDVQLTVTDTAGASSTATAVVSLNNTPPRVEITSFKDGDRYPLNGTNLLRLAAEVSDEEHSNEELMYAWRTFLHHNDHFHPDPVDFERESFTLISPLGCHDEFYWYRIALTVTDPGGLATTVSQQIYPNCDPPFLDELVLSAEPDESKIVLNWQANLTGSVDQYLVQRSSDFLHFDVIGTLDENTFTFVDAQPLKGSNIYRIKAISSDRAFMYSNLVATSFPKKPAIQVFPNPATDFFRIFIEEPESALVHFELYEENGVRIFKDATMAESGIPFEKSFLTQYFPNQFYFYKIWNGNLERAGKLIINR
ncbi:MAG TPA: PQQ-dependent sugar dehydrogenase [Saprospiraceae bacterium]|nr:PQQ-dependent sugar dehydrogenase [Saprospiraceae bacterium]HMQ82608.1 PQQ-dependent sugar dehydrogenase [Saprospiraceae bacterium]